MILISFILPNKAPNGAALAINPIRNDTYYFD